MSRRAIRLSPVRRRRRPRRRSGRGHRRDPARPERARLMRGTANAATIGPSAVAAVIIARRLRQRGFDLQLARRGAPAPAAGSAGLGTQLHLPVPAALEHLALTRPARQDGPSELVARQDGSARAFPNPVPGRLSPDHREPAGGTAIAASGSCRRRRADRRAVGRPRARQPREARGLREADRRNLATHHRAARRAAPARQVLRVLSSARGRCRRARGGPASSSPTTSTTPTTTS